MARWQNYIFPALLMVCLPTEVGIALLRGTYPTQATVLVIIEFILGLWLAQRISKHTALISPAPSITEAEAVISAQNSRLNRMLGAGFIIFSLLLTLFLLVSFVMVSPRPVASTTFISTMVEIGFGLLFNFLVAAMMFAGVRIYLVGLTDKVVSQTEK